MRRALGAAALLVVLVNCGHGGSWSPDEKELLRDLAIGGHAEAPAPDPSNRVADDRRAARLGRALFFEHRLSANQQIACATCHDPARDHQDGLPLAHGLGTTARRTMPLAGLASTPWLFWDGRKDSLWSQALGPLESGVEHGSDRVQVVRVLASHHRAPYEEVFGPLPELAHLPAAASPLATDQRWDAWMQMSPADQRAVNVPFANAGKAIAAYERVLAPNPSRFDAYVDAVVRGDEATARKLFDEDEREGLRLFVGKANCTQCHNGPRLTNDDFANTGIPAAPSLPLDTGRELGARVALQDEFNCRGPYSDARPEQCRELAALRVGREHGPGAFKVPSLRNVPSRAPFMHAGQLATLEDVVDHYNRAPASPVGSSELRPLGLTAREKRQLVRFLGTLAAPPATEPDWLQDRSPDTQTSTTAMPRRNTP